MLTDRLGLPASMQGLFAHLIERWDGKGLPGRARHEEIPLPVRIASVARDAAFQRLLGGLEFAQVVRGRAGARSTRPWPSRSPTRPPSSWPRDAGGSVWEETLACEPGPRLTLEGEAIDRALGAMGDFADLASPYLVGHSAGVAELAMAAAQRCRLSGPPPWCRSGAARWSTISGVWRSRSASAEGGAAHAGRLGAGQAARLPRRARPHPLPVPGRARVRGRLPPRASRRLGLPPGNRRRRDRRRRTCSPPPTPTTP